METIESGTAMAGANRIRPAVIPLERQRHGPGRSGSDPGSVRVIAVASGKGGVGKSSLVVNLGIALARFGKRVMALDGDLGLGNLDILMGLAPRYNLSHVLRNERTMAQIVLEGPGGLRLLPAASGLPDLANLSPETHRRIVSELDAILEDVDYLLLDTGPGLSPSVIHFNAAAREVLVVTTPEPAAITDAYALIKVMTLRHPPRPLHLVTNAADSLREGEAVAGQLQRVSRRFLGASPGYLGCVLRDEFLLAAVRRQRAVADLYPDSRSGRCCVALARRLMRLPAPGIPSETSPWRHFRAE